MGRLLIKNLVYTKVINVPEEIFLKQYESYINLNEKDALQRIDNFQKRIKHEENCIQLIKEQLNLLESCRAEDIMDLANSFSLPKFIELKEEDTQLLNSDKTFSKPQRSYETSNRIDVMKWFGEYDIAIVSSYRSILENVTERTWMDNKKAGSKIAKSDNKYRKKNLRNMLNEMDCAIIPIEILREDNGIEISVHSYFIANTNKRDDFYSKMFDISEYFNQDSFVYIEKNTQDLIITGTNTSDNPGYKKQISIEEYIANASGKVFDARFENCLHQLTENK